MAPVDLYEAFAQSANHVVETRQRHEAEIGQAVQRHQANEAALVDALPEGVVFSPVENPTPLIRRVGSQIVPVIVPWIGTLKPGAPDVAAVPSVPAPPPIGS